MTENDVCTVARAGRARSSLAIALTRRGLFAIVLDEEAARVAGIPVGALNALLAVLTAVTVVAAMRVVGVLLVAALMVLPVATSRVVARSFRTTTLGAGAVGMVAVVLGLAAARQWALAAGGAIVLVAVALFAATSIAAPLRRGRAPDDAGALLRPRLTDVRERRQQMPRPRGTGSPRRPRRGGSRSACAVAPPDASPVLPV